MIPPFVALALAWLIGMWWADTVAVPFSAGLVFMGFSAGLLATLFAKHRFTRPYTSSVLVMGILVTLFFAGGATRVAFSNSHRDTLSDYNNSDHVVVIGTVDRYPERRDRYTAYTVSADALFRNGETVGVAVHGLLVVHLSRFSTYEFGDRLRLEGRLLEPSLSPSFNYRAYLASRDIHSTFRARDVALLGRGYGAPFYQAVNAARSRAEELNQRLLPEPHASVLNGIVLGLNSAIPSRVQDYFDTTGTTHVLVISGANFTVLVAVMLFLFQAWFGRNWGIQLTLGGILFYALVVGAGPPILRAAVMGAISVYALLTRRTSVALNSLAIAVVVLTALFPAQRSHIGFQLSVLATTGLIVLTPLLSRVVNWVADRLGAHNPAPHPVVQFVAAGLLATAAAQIATTPLIIGSIGRLSPWALFTNLLILPVQPLIMQSGMLATLAGMVFMPLGKVISVVPYAGIMWTLAVVERMAGLPFASVPAPSMSPASVWILYGTAAFLLWFATLPVAPQPPSPFEPRALFGLSRRAVVTWGVLLLLAVVPWWVFRQQPDGRLHLYMFDVGQGEAMMIVTPDGKQVLVDGGKEASWLLQEVGEVMPYWDRTLEMVVLTHPDEDHLGGLTALLTRYSADIVLSSGDEASTEVHDVWMATIERAGTNVQTAVAGQQIDLGSGVAVRVLAPGTRRFSEENQNSVVLELRYGHFCALLTGDIEFESEEQLVQSDTLSSCQVLKVPHHGSATSTSDRFLDRVAPAYALISVGSGNEFGHPAPRVVSRLEARGTRIFRTDLHGTIHLSTDGEALWAESSR